MKGRNINYLFTCATITLLIISTLNCSVITTYMLINDTSSHFTIQYEVEATSGYQLFTSLPEICHFKGNAANRKAKLSRCQVIERHSSEVGKKQLQLAPGQGLKFGEGTNRFHRPNDPGYSDRFNINQMLISNSQQMIKLSKKDLIAAIQPMSNRSYSYGIFISELLP